MTQDSITQGSWRIHLLVTGSVFFTLLLALLLAQLDSLQRQILPSPVAQAIANLNATNTNTPLPAIPLASGTPAAPGSASSANAGVDTAVSVLPNCAAPPGWVLTSIPSGETLFTLSLRYNLSEETIRLANCLQPGSPVNVSALYLPNPAVTPNPTAVCGPPQNWVLYTVRRGETLFILATRYGTSITAIINANCLTNTNIQAGQRIYLPPAAAFPPAASATPQPTLTSTSTPTASATATGTSTPTSTSTVPSLPTSSATATITATGTTTPTASATATLGTTPIVTATAAPSVSPTANNTPTFTPTAMPTSPTTPTASVSPTNSPVPTATATNTTEPTATALVAPSATPTP